MPNSPPTNPDPAADAYDAFPYPGHSYPQTQPDRLATLATLYGLTPPPAPLRTCRVLELGCGDGANLMPVALALPDSTCVGVDLSAEAIARGQSLAAEAGIKNLSLSRTDVAAITPEFGKFDFIIAHGLYSWVPPAAQERVLSVCKSNLAPGGVAYVSYNAYPGCRVRRITREMMRFHVAGFPTPQEKVAQGRALVKFLADAKEENDPWGRLLRWELEHLANEDPGPVFHDDLADVNEPLYFHEFAARAARHGLQYLSEAQLSDVEYAMLDAPASLAGARGRFAQAVAALAGQLPADDVVGREQYADFVRGRRFRQTLLCHAEATVSRPPAPERVASLFASAAVRSEAGEADVRSDAPVTFVTEKGASVVTRQPLAKAALLELARARPRPLAFEELLARATERARPDGGSPDDARPALAKLLLTAYASNVVGLRSHVPPLVSDVSERPVASPLARAQAKRGPVVTDLLGTHVKLVAPLVQQVLLKCDGTRDRETIVVELAAAVTSGKATIEREGRKVTDPAQIAEMLRGAVAARLDELARLALLVA